MEKKILGFEISELKEQQTDNGVNIAIVEGYAAFKNNLDYGYDRILDGAFKKGLEKNNGKWAVQRDHSYKMADTVGENVEAREDSKGLFTRTEINLDTESGRDTYSKVKHAKANGRNVGLSIGYSADEFEYVKKKGVTERHLKAVTIGEHSFVVFPMNPKATITTVKSILEEGDAEAIAHKKQDLEATLREAGCSQTEAKAAVSAIFAHRDGAEDEKGAIALLNEIKSLLKGESNE
jgi:HK97 family phage prohead protease